MVSEEERASYEALYTMAGVLILSPLYQTPEAIPNSTVQTVAVLQDEAMRPLFAVSYLPVTGTSKRGTESEGVVSITVVSDPELSAEQAHQLWMVLPAGADVQSVGMLPSKVGETITLALPVALDDALEFAVSLEPTGGVPGPEHGPVVARTFIVTTEGQQ